MSNALVLGGGGVGGIAWMTGLLAGMADAGWDVTAAELIVGTSAGATVAAQLDSGLTLDELCARQSEPELQGLELMVDVDLASYAAEIASVMSGASSPAEARVAVGSYALAASTVGEAARMAVIESRLPSYEWPQRALKLVAVDAESGEPRVFTNDSGVSLLDAVAASCAVPGIWPPVTIEGRRYMDGGVRSGANADLAAGARRVLVIAPLGAIDLFPTELPLDAAVGSLLEQGAEVAIVSPDAASAAAIGANPLDPAIRRPAALAGRAQGRALEVSQA
jgi:NTE family protein